MFYVLLLSVHSLTSRDSHHVVNILYGATTREVVDRTSNTLQDRTDSYGITQTLNELLANITNLQVGEYEDISFTGDVRAGSLLGTY